MIRFSCRQCGAVLRVSDDNAGKIANCPKCRHKTPIPHSVDGRNPDAGGSAPPKEKLVLSGFELVDDEPAAAPPTEQRYTAKPVAHARPSAINEQAAPTRKRPSASDDDDLDDDGRDDDDSRDDEEPVRRRRRRRRKRRQSTSSSYGMYQSFFNPFLFILATVLGMWVIAIGIKLAGVYIAGLVALGLAAVIALSGRVWFLQIAFSEDSTTGYMCIYIPFYSLYFMLTNLEETWKPMVTQAVGATLVGISLCAGALWSEEDLRSTGGGTLYDVPSNDDDEEDPQIAPAKPNNARPPVGNPSRRPRRAPRTSRHDGVSPMVLSAIRWKSAAISLANPSTARLDRSHTSLVAAPAGGEDAST